MHIDDHLLKRAQLALGGISHKEKEQLPLVELVSRVKKAIQSDQLSKDTYLYAAIKTVAKHTNIRHTELRNAQKFGLSPECYLLRISAGNLKLSHN